MLKTSIFSFVTAALAFGCEGDIGPAGPAGPPGGVDPDAPALDKAFAGAGGRDALSGLSTVRITASGERLLTLEGFVPEDDSHTINTFTTETAADVAGDRLHIGYKRNLAIFGATTDARIIIDKDVGVSDGVESVFGFPGGPLSSDRWASTLRQHRLLNPQLILRDIALGKLTATDAGVALRDGELRHRIDVADAVSPISLFVDRYTGELTDVATFENDYVAGDAVLEAHYLGWRTWDDSGVLFPADVVIALDDQPIHIEHRTAVAANVALDASLFAFPAGATPTHVAADADRGARNGQFHESFAGLGVPLDGLQTFVEAQQLAPGVHHLRGGSHNSLVIEQAAGVVVVEAPLYEARAQALYAWIAANIPGKPVTHVIATHHHRDHVGSLRTFVARGARVVVGERAQPYFARAFRAARTVEPDELAAAPRAPAIDTVRIGGELVLPDANRPVRVIHVPSTHSADMVVAYTPNQRVLFVSDIYSPGIPANPVGAREVLDVVVAKNLAIDAIAGGHGAVGPRSGLEAAAGL